MWYTLGRPKAEPEFAEAMTETLRSVLRNLVLVTAAAFVLWLFVVPDVRPDGLALTFLFAMPLFATMCALVLWLASKHLLAAQIVWQIGLTAVTVVAVHVFQEPAIALVLALFPLMAVATLGWPAGLVSEALVSGLAWYLARTPSTLSLPSTYAWTIVLGGALSGTLGWAAVSPLVSANRWSLFHYRQARKEALDAHGQRLELKQVQEDLLQANRELAMLSDRLAAMYQVAGEARRAKEEFVANVSHELRTPLNMIIGFSEMITQSPQVYGEALPPKLLADMAVIRRNSQRLARLVDDVLDLSQVEAGRLALSKEWSDVRDIVDEAVLALQPLFEAKGLYLDRDVPPDLPPIFCDNTRVSQVVTNILSNAGRYTQRGGVQVRAWREQNDVVVSVSDTGPGIAPEDQVRLFEPFQQLDTSIRRLHEGSGLGLSISKQFVEVHGGRMWLESPSTAPQRGEGGPGTTFYFSLPFEAPVSAPLAGDDVARWFSPYSEHEYRLRTRRSKAPPPEVQSRFVLLEEGDALQRLFQRYWDDAEIVPVQRACEAIQELSRTPAQALIINASSFKETPISTDQLTDLPYDTPAMTCWVPGEDAVAERLGIVRYLVKPVTREALLSALDDLGEDVESVLLVDDEPEALQLFTRMLASAPRGYQVIQARSGRRALSLLRQRRPDVMLLDLIMPGLDGFKVLQQKDLDLDTRDIPVIVISARDPMNEPIVSSALTVTHGGGLSVSNLLACIQAVSEVLIPISQPAGPGQPETLAAPPVS